MKFENLGRRSKIASCLDFHAAIPYSVVKPSNAVYAYLLAKDELKMEHLPVICQLNKRLAR